ncbi:hypothetical protein ERO13_D03G071101v2 [Gossypium hirsutum]|nr:hypothetical protein ERO13_D03G071101v2 [Gossypium hirsutum]
MKKPMSIHQPLRRRESTRETKGHDNCTQLSACTTLVKIMPQQSPKHSTKTIMELVERRWRWSQSHFSSDNH